MTDRTEGDRRKLYAAAQITAIVCDAERDAADEVAEALCTESDFIERHGDREGGCGRLAIATYESAREEVEVVLDEHGLSEYIDKVEKDTIWQLMHGYLGTLDEFVERQEPRAMAESIRHGVVGLAEGLEESLQLSFGVEYVWEPSEEEVEAFRRYERSLAALLDRSEAVRTEPSTTSLRQQAATGNSTQKQAVTDNSIQAQVGRVIDNVLRSIGDFFR